MVSLGYAWSELRRRWSRTLVTALGLAAGVGLVMGIVGVSNGLSDAQNKVLSPLSSVGTDIVVERTVGVASTSPSTATTTTTTSPGGFGRGPGGGGGFFAGAGNAGANASDRTALAANNSSVITDLSKLGPAGTKFTYDFFVTGTLITFPQSAVADVSKIAGVESAVPGLSLQALHESGTVPQVTDTLTTGGQTITQTQTPAPLTAAERTAVRTCLENSGAFPTPSTTTTTPGGTTTTTPGGTSGAGGGFGGGGFGGGGGGFGGGGGLSAGALDSRFGAAFTQCLPQRFQQYEAQVVVPQQTITRVLNPPSTDTQTKGYTVAGVNPSNTTSGLITKAQLVSGTWFTSKPADEILVSTAYASTNGIKVGQTLTIDTTGYKVVGLVNPTLTGDVSDIYFDLATLQSSSSQASRINEVLVKVAKSSDVDGVATAIKKELPGATVLTSKQLAGQVTGSLSNAKKLASDLGVALGIIILAAALLIAALLTLSSVAKRVREIGTLRAVGWSRGRVVSQILAEMLGIGVVGAALGVLVGLGVCAAVNAFGPTLAYSTTGAVVGSSSASNLVHATTAAASAIGRTVKLHTSISVVTVVVAAAIAILGGLVAGVAGALRAARLAPASALRDLG
ncbi:MAG TPA: ABC transporter permease [Acidimicrobiales bacterium]|nr:ABC transporter permease [Acidimicrobiales bacterium]